MFTYFPRDEGLSITIVYTAIAKLFFHRDGADICDMPDIMREMLRC